jgi:hypothetical protein
MDRLKEHLRRTGRLGVAVAVFLFMAAVVQASDVGFYNNCDYPIWVQGTTMVKGQPQRGPLMKIMPHATAWDKNVPAGDRIIVVYDRANQILCQETRAVAAKGNVFQWVVPAPQNGKGHCNMIDPPPPKK